MQLFCGVSAGTSGANRVGSFREITGIQNCWGGAFLLFYLTWKKKTREAYTSTTFGCP